MITWSEIAELRRISSQRTIGCCPALAVPVMKIVEAAALNGLRFAVFMGLRTWDQQAALYAQGRLPLEEITRLRDKVGMPQISLSDAAKKITNAPAGSSWHNYGLAVDLVEDGDASRAGVQWSWSNNASYLKLGAIVANAGLEWGGLWKSIKDYPHAELTCGVSLDEARALSANGKNLEAVWQVVTNKLPAYWPK